MLLFRAERVLGARHCRALELQIDPSHRHAARVWLVRNRRVRGRQELLDDEAKWIVGRCQHILMR